MNESHRIQQVLSGNSSAFSYFVETYQHMAITIAYRIIGNMQDAEDVVQESYLKAFRNLHTFRKESKFSSWFYRIVYNTAVTTSKAKIWTDDINNDPSVYASLSEFDADNQLHEKETTENIDYILNQMPKGDALILTLFYLQEHTTKEIAEITALNNSNIKVRLFRARQLFRELWTKQYEIPIFK